MILDSQNLFSQDQAVTATAASTNVIDLGADRDIGIGEEELYIFAQVTTAFTAGGAATMRLQVQTATDAAFTTPITLAQSDDIPVASLVAGYQPISFTVPAGTRQYLRLNYVVGTGPMTAGKITAGLVPDQNLQKYYKRNYVA